LCAQESGIDDGNEKEKDCASVHLSDLCAGEIMEKNFGAAFSGSGHADRPPLAESNAVPAASSPDTHGGDPVVGVPIDFQVEERAAEISTGVWTAKHPTDFIREDAAPRLRAAVAEDDLQFTHAS
jgi:hypothetical protein